MTAMYLSLSIHTTGPSLLHPLGEIGIAYGTNSDDVVKKRWAIRCTPETEAALVSQMADYWQAEYKQTRWDRDELWNEVQADPNIQSAKDVYIEVAQFLNDITAEFKGDCIWLSEGDSAEMNVLDFWLLTTGNRFLGCRFDVDGEDILVENPFDTPEEDEDAVEEVERLLKESGLDEKQLLRSDDRAHLVLLRQFAVDKVQSCCSSTDDETGSNQS